jgi:hypothetical protein
MILWTILVSILMVVYFGIVGSRTLIIAISIYVLSINLDSCSKGIRILLDTVECMAQAKWSARSDNLTYRDREMRGYCIDNIYDSTKPIELYACHSISLYPTGRIVSAELSGPFLNPIWFRRSLA